MKDTEKQGVLCLCNIGKCHSFTDRDIMAGFERKTTGCVALMCDWCHMPFSVYFYQKTLHVYPS